MDRQSDREKLKVVGGGEDGEEKNQFQKMEGERRGREKGRDCATKGKTREGRGQRERNGRMGRRRKGREGTTLTEDQEGEGEGGKFGRCEGKDRDRNGKTRHRHPLLGPLLSSTLCVHQSPFSLSYTHIQNLSNLSPPFSLPSLFSL